MYRGLCPCRLPIFLVMVLFLFSSVEAFITGNQRSGVLSRRKHTARSRRSIITAVNSVDEEAELNGKLTSEDSLEAHFKLGYFYDLQKRDLEAVEQYQKAADRGHAEAQFKMGVMCDDGRGLQKNESQAASWFELSHLQGFGKASHNLAIMTSIGNGVPKDTAKAVAMFHAAAEAGIPGSQCAVAMMYENGHEGVNRDDPKAFSWYQKAANLDFAPAMFSLGCLYEEGRGVMSSDPMAVRWWALAAEKGDTNAQYNLAFMHSSGRGGLLKNSAAAVALYRKAAEQGHTDAMLNLGVMYEEGDGVPESDELSGLWHAKAAELGNPVAQFNLGVMCRTGRGGVVPADKDAAVTWFRKAAASGFVEAMYELGDLYAENDEEDKAQEWYDKANETEELSQDGVLELTEKAQISWE